MENYYTKGNENYPEYMVKAYQLINEYRHRKKITNDPASYGVEFYQKGTEENNDQNNENW